MNFGQLKQAVWDWLGVGQERLPASTCGQIINICQKELLRRYDLRFGEYTYTFNLVANQREYDLPEGFSRPYQMYAVRGGRKFDISFLTREEFLVKFGSGTDTGVPINYTIYADKILFGPTPAASATAYFDIYRLLPDLVSDTDTNDLLEKAWEVILFMALEYATTYLIEDARAQLWAAKADKLIGQLVREYSRSFAAARRPVTQEP